MLRYHREDRLNLDLHVDDLLAYGETILDLSLESDSALTLRRQDRGPGDTGWARGFARGVISLREGRPVASVGQDSLMSPQRFG